jgi:four helix bundle protein
MTFRSEELVKRTKALALRIINLHESLPAKGAGYVLGNQILRAGTSVGANYRESIRSRSKAEFIAKMGDCLKELDETAYWIELLVESNMVPEAKLDPLKQEVSELCAIFYTIIRNTKLKL